MADADRGSVKGSVLESRLDFARRKRGEPFLARVLARLTDEDRRILGSLLPFSWYPFETNERLDLAIRDELGAGDELFRELGVASATHNLTSASQLHYIRVRDPHALLKQASAIYGIYYNSGYRTYERVNDKMAILRTHDSKSFSIADCLTVVGWHEKAIEMCGGRTVTVIENKCRARGDSICEYVCEWT